jgi:hypothetical protein
MEAESEQQRAGKDGGEGEDAMEVSESVADRSMPGLPESTVTHVHLGSPSVSQSTILEIKEMHNRDRAFANFRRKFTQFVNDCLPSYGMQLHRWTRFEPTFKVQLSYFSKEKSYLFESND